MVKLAQAEKRVSSLGEELELKERISSAEEGLWLGQRKEKNSG